MRRAISIVTIALVLSGCASKLDTALTVQANGYVPQAHPFRHDTRLYLDAQSAAAQWQAKNAAAWLDPITRTPQALWLTTEKELDRVPEVVESAATQKALLVVVSYFIPNRDCQGFGALSSPHFAQWIDQLRRNLGSTPAVVILEPDAIAADCFTSQRAELLRQGVISLASAGHYVYLDAGHPRWRTTAEAARRLIASGIQYANGFSINVSNRISTLESQRWGLELSDLVGGREFVIDTSRNGIGPPPETPDSWCNPRHQALGEEPSTAPPLLRTAALLWIKRPGESDGTCGGEEGFDFSAVQARNLIDNANSPPEPDDSAGQQLR